MDHDDMLARILRSDLNELMSLSYLVLANNQVTNRHIERRYDMPVQCWSALHAVGSFPGLRARDIVALFPRPQNTISRAVALLDRRGLIAQTACPKDARAKLLFPTPEGARLLAEIRHTVAQRQAEMFGVLTPDERTAFLTLCHKIAAGPNLTRSLAMPDPD